jgi:diaminopimelate epimerase
VRFTKAHGTGNDFVVIGDLEDTWKPNEGFVRAVCDRHVGIGGDGVIRIAPADDAYFMDYWNADGTTAEMCGNGVRVVAKWLADRGHVTGETAAIETRGGRKVVELIRGSDGTVEQVRVDMGPPVLAADEIPVLAADPEHVPLESGGHLFDAICVSMGNPHAVLFVDALDAIPFETLGPAFEAHPAFPARTNVEFVERTGPDRLRMRVFERGVGETQACGTGACAVGVAAVRRGITGRDVTIDLPGGTLRVEWLDRVFMTGPAVEVFEAELPDPFLALL